MYASEYSYCMLWLVLGPQGSGKSSAVFHQLRQIRVPVQILDVKGTWEFRAEQLRCEVIPPEYIRFDRPAKGWGWHKCRPHLPRKELAL